MGYWILTAALLIVGVLTGFSIGVVILPVALAMLVLGPVRHRPRVFWPVLLGVVGRGVGFMLVAPLTCTATGPIGDGATGSTTTVITLCSTILGFVYRGTGLDNPPLEPASAVALAVGLATAAITLGALIVRDRRGRVGGTPPA